MWRVCIWANFGTPQAAEKGHTQSTCMACAWRFVRYEASVRLIPLTTSGPSSSSEAHASKLVASVCIRTFLPIVGTFANLQECVIVGLCCFNIAGLVLARCGLHSTKLSADRFEHNIQNAS